MNTLLLLAALSSQITFNTTQQGEIYTIVPGLRSVNPACAKSKFLPFVMGKEGKAVHSRKQPFLCPLINPLI